MVTLDEFKAAMDSGAGTMDRYGNVTKWNHNHGARGRFASGSQPRVYAQSQTVTPSTPIITGTKTPGSPKGPKTRPGDVKHKPQGA